MKKIKKNALKSFLFICLGLTFTTIVFASAKLIYVPSSPGRPEVIEISKDRCTLEYRAPIDEGGAPVTHYLIEYRNIHWEWQGWILKGTSKTLKFQVNDMIEGTEVIFRVTAVNKEGESRPSLSSSPVIFRDQF